jgi:putative glycosyltransferase (TIGR04372 family)
MDLEERERIVTAYLSSRNLGDFTEQLICAAMCPSVDLEVVRAPDKKTPLEYFDVYAGAEIFDDPGAVEMGIHRSSLVLAGHALRSCALPSFPWVPKLRVPDQVRARSVDHLQALGLDPDRWFACFYWREPGYMGREPLPLRDILDPSPYLAAIDHVIDTLGGQVVRLGHPTPTTLRNHPSIIDLAKIEDSLATQITSISLARFFISSPSGPLTFGPGVGTPTAVTDNIDISGVWNDDDILVTQTIEIPNGRRYRQRAAYKAGFLRPGIAKQLSHPDAGCRFTKCTGPEIIHVANLLHQRTINVERWREPSAASDRPKTSQLPFPLMASVKEASLIEMPSG